MVRGLAAVRRAGRRLKIDKGSGKGGMGWDSPYP